MSQPSWSPDNTYPLAERYKPKADMPTMQDELQCTLLNVLFEQQTVTSRPLTLNSSRFFSAAPRSNEYFENGVCLKTAVQLCPPELDHRLSVVFRFSKETLPDKHVEGQTYVAGFVSSELSF
jgi:hypothetical protein